MAEGGNTIPGPDGLDVDIEAEFAAFDSLPSWARHALNYAGHGFTATGEAIGRLLDKGPETFRRSVKGSSRRAWERIWRNDGLEPPR